MIILLNLLELDESILQVDVLKLLKKRWMKSQFLVYLVLQNGSALVQFYPPFLLSSAMMLQCTVGNQAVEPACSLMSLLQPFQRFQESSQRMSGCCGWLGRLLDPLQHL